MRDASLTGGLYYCIGNQWFSQWLVMPSPVLTQLESISSTIPERSYAAASHAGALKTINVFQSTLSAPSPPVEDTVWLSSWDIGARASAGFFQNCFRIRILTIWNLYIFFWKLYIYLILWIWAEIGLG